MASLPYYTTDSLIDAIKRNAAIPVHQQTFKNDDFIAFLNEEMSMGLVPNILRMKENYFLVTENIPLVANKNQYEIPRRAIGNKVREISFKDSTDSIYEMTQIQIGDLPYYNVNSGSSDPSAYYISNNIINLLTKNPGSSGFLSVSYYIRPNQLVLLADVGIIQSIDRTTGEIFLDKLPVGFSVTQEFDFIQHTSPHKCINIDVNLTGTNALTKTITLAVADIPENLQIGDHICLAQQSAIPQIPSDMHALLAHKATARCVAAQGDMEGLQILNSKIQEFSDNSMNLIDDRVEDSPKKIVNRNSSIRNGLTSRRSRFRG